MNWSNNFCADTAHQSNIILSLRTVEKLNILIIWGHILFVLFQCVQLINLNCLTNPKIWAFAPLRGLMWWLKIKIPFVLKSPKFKLVLNHICLVGLFHVDTNDDGRIFEVSWMYFYLLRDALLLMNICTIAGLFKKYFFDW